MKTDSHLPNLDPASDARLSRTLLAPTGTKVAEVRTSCNESVRLSGALEILDFGFSISPTTSHQVVEQSHDSNIETRPVKALGNTYRCIDYTKEIRADIHKRFLHCLLQGLVLLFLLAFLLITSAFYVTLRSGDAFLSWWNSRLY